MVTLALVRFGFWSASAMYCDPCISGIVPNSAAERLAPEKIGYVLASRVWPLIAAGMPRA